MLFFLLFIAVVVLESFKLLFVLDLIRDVVLATLSITETAAILVGLLLEIARRLHIRVILVLLSTEALVNQVNEDALTEVAKLKHASQVSVNSL